jgi:hypothetical protein
MNFSKINQNNFLLDKQIRLVLSSFFPGANLNNPNRYIFRCNVCGDSKTNKRKKRGYILNDGSRITYYCHNCGVRISAVNWLKEYFNFYYRAYVKELLMNNKQETNISKPIIQKVIKKTIEITDEEKKQIKFFVPILKGKGELFDLAIEMCKTRLIPEVIWKKWFVCINSKDKENIYRNRLIIPFYDDKGKIYYFQGKKLFSYQEPNYLSRNGEDLNCIYNYYTVDKSKEVIVQEGPIDSCCIENSVATTGASKTEKWLSVFPKKRYLFDFDKTGLEKSMEMLLKGEWIFLWKLFAKDLGLRKKSKWDMNQLMIVLNRKEPFTYKELEKYFTNNSNMKAFLV